MAWIYLVCAGFLEIVWAYAMKQSEGFTRLTPTIVTLVAMIASFGLLSLSMRTLPLGTAYVIWTGIGAVGAFIVGAAVMGEPLGLTRVVAAVLIISGLILMKIATPS
jgi:quaternary ammonium compound-resistance protein SugE